MPSGSSMPPSRVTSSSGSSSCAPSSRSSQFVGDEGRVEGGILFERLAEDRIGALALVLGDVALAEGLGSQGLVG